MIDYLGDIKPLEDQGISDATILQFLRDRTASPISCEVAKELLQENAAVIIDPVNHSKSGLLISYYQTLEVGTEAQVLIAYFIEHVFGGGDAVRTNEYPRSIQWSSVTSAMPAELQPVVSALLDSANGRPDADANSDDMVVAKEDYEKEEARVERQIVFGDKHNEYVSPVIQDPNATDADIKLALETMAATYGA